MQAQTPPGAYLPLHHRPGQNRVMSAKQHPGLTTMLSRLVATPSVSSVNAALDMGNQSLIELLASWVEGLGFQAEILTVDAAANKANLVATLGSGVDGLVLAGHTDTVPYDQHAWRHDPFRLTEVDDRLYGLGTADMKSFFALAIAAASQFAASTLRRPLVILATADEESTMQGARALVARGHSLGRYALIGEPTGLRPARMHKGMMMEAIRVRGHPAHSSDPDLGASALEGMHRVMGYLLDWRRDLQQHHRHPMFKVSVPTLNLGSIRGGDNPNRICAECELQIDLRPLPGMELESLRETMRAGVRRCLERTGLEVNFEALFPGAPALETDPSSALVRATEEATGHQAGAVSFATEAPFLCQLGLDTVILGPGDVAQAHRPDEYLERACIQPMVGLLEQLIHRFCVVESATPASTG